MLTFPICSEVLMQRPKKVTRLVESLVAYRQAPVVRGFLPLMTPADTTNSQKPPDESRSEPDNWQGYPKKGELPATCPLRAVTRGQGLLVMFYIVDSMLELVGALARAILGVLVLALVLDMLVGT